MKITNTWDWWFLKGKERLKKTIQKQKDSWYEPKLCKWQCLINFVRLMVEVLFRTKNMDLGVDYSVSRKLAVQK